MVKGYLDLGAVINTTASGGETVWSGWISGLEWVRRAVLIVTLGNAECDVLLQLKAPDGAAAEPSGLWGAIPPNKTSAADVLLCPGAAFRLGVTVGATESPIAVAVRAQVLA